MFQAEGRATGPEVGEPRRNEEGQQCPHGWRGTTRARGEGAEARNGVVASMRTPVTECLGSYCGFEQRGDMI